MEFGNFNLEAVREGALTGVSFVEDFRRLKSLEKVEGGHDYIIVSGIVVDSLLSPVEISEEPIHIQENITTFNRNYPPEHPFQLEIIQEIGFLAYEGQNNHLDLVMSDGVEVPNKYVASYHRETAEIEWKKLDRRAAIDQLAFTLNEAKKRLKKGGALIVEDVITVGGLDQIEIWYDAIDSIGAEVISFQDLDSQEQTIGLQMGKLVSNPNILAYRMDIVFPEQNDNQSWTDIPAPPDEEPIPEDYDPFAYLYDEPDPFAQEQEEDDMVPDYA